MIEITINKIKNYILNRKKTGLYWKSFTTILTLIILVFLYSRGIVAIATINNRPVTMRELIMFFDRDKKDNIIDQEITKKIIELEAIKNNIYISTSEIEAEINRLSFEAIQSGYTIYQLIQTAEEDSKELENKLRLRMAVYRLLESGNQLSEEQIDRYIDENKDLFDPDQEEYIRAELKYLFLNKNITNDYESWIRDANAKIEVKYLIDLDNI